jgi:glycosyltransferase involved in cell wall biosynthesis
MQKYKILFLVQLPPPIHGVSIINNFIFNSQSIRKNFTCHYLPLKFSKEIKNIGTYNISKFIGILSYSIKLLLSIIILKPNIIYFTMSPTGIAFYRDVIFIAIIKLFNIKLVFHLHGKGIESKYKKSCFNRILYNFAFKNVHIIHLAKLLVKDIAIIKSISTSKIYILSNGIKLIKSTPNKKLNKDRIVILFFSNFIKDKGILDFVYALKDIKSDYKAFIAGNDGNISSLELSKEIISLGLEEKIKIIGPKYGFEKDNIFLTADIFILPTKNDCFPLVILEAMQFGTAIISTKIGAIPEMISDCGVLIEPNNIDQLISSIETLLNEPSKIIELSVKAKDKFLNNYTLDTFESNFISIMNDIAKYKYNNEANNTKF